MERLQDFDVYRLEVDDIFSDHDFNCRDFFTPQSVAELAESIRQHGLHFPVVVQPSEDTEIDADGRPYRLISGHRRLAAVQLLGWDAIPATVRQGLSEKEAQILNLLENLERKDLNIAEEALALVRIYPDGVSLRVAARELNRPTRWVHTRLRLCEAPQRVLELARSGLLGAATLDPILRLESPEEQIRMAERVVAHKREHGETASLAGVQSRYRRKAAPTDTGTREQRRNKEQLAAMVTLIDKRDLGQYGMFAKYCLSWAAGYTTIEELNAEIDRIEDVILEERIASGMSQRKIAELRGWSIHTLRKELRRVREKVNG